MLLLSFNPFSTQIGAAQLNHFVAQFNHFAAHFKLFYFKSAYDSKIWPKCCTLSIMIVYHAVLLHLLLKLVVPLQ